MTACPPVGIVRGQGGFEMTKTSANTWRHKGWGIDFFGTGYMMTRLKKVDGVTITRTADSLYRAKVIIDNAELEIKALGRLAK